MKDLSSWDIDPKRGQRTCVLGHMPTITTETSDPKTQNIRQRAYTTECTPTKGSGTAHPGTYIKKDQREAHSRKYTLKSWETAKCTRKVERDTHSGILTHKEIRDLKHWDICPQADQRSHNLGHIPTNSLGFHILEQTARNKSETSKA